jgi:hypothetical protein
VIELVLLLPDDTGTDFRCYPIMYYPFRHEELLHCLKEAGFQKIQPDFDETKDSYTVIACNGFKSPEPTAARCVISGG